MNNDLFNNESGSSTNNVFLVVISVIFMTYLIYRPECDCVMATDYDYTRNNIGLKGFEYFDSDNSDN
jgi:hypothetical protein